MQRQLISSLRLAAVATALLASRLCADPSDRCLTAAREAAERTGVPESVLIAISQTETGRGAGDAIRPWPWTVNMEGEGRWFDTPEEALAYVRERQAQGARSFDLGCFQINHRWHGMHFDSLEAMMEPLPNALYAAQFLRRLHDESGDWSVAAGAYHSRTEVYATRYRARFDRLLAAAEGGQAPQLLARGTAEVRVNAFPLLQGGAAGTMGSLVPIGGGG
jgi:hypothetical protein